jgi:hypothetical protein
MALDKLGIYNDALMLLGERRLSTISDAREPRYGMDAIWDLGAVDYCLSVVRPKFAIATSKITSSTTDTDHGYTNVFSLPANFLSVVEVYADSALDQPISRRFIDSTKICVNYSTIYLRYNADNTFAIPSGTDFTVLSPEFVRVLTAYMAREYAMRVSPDDVDKIESLYISRVKDAMEIDKQNEPDRRPQAATGTLTTEWLKIYNDALLILGIEKIKSGTDDSFARSVLDQAVDSGVVAAALSDIGWQFGITSAQSDYNPSYTMPWGYQYGHDYPADMHILNGIYIDENFTSPLKLYQTEAGVFYCDYQTVYVQYVSTDYLTAPASWPISFKRYVAAQMAKDSVGLLKADPNRVEMVFKQRRHEAKSVDAQQSPPRIIMPGSWVRSRLHSHDGSRR